jgi:hypothetical protein
VHLSKLNSALEDVLDNRFRWKGEMVRPERIELPTSWFVAMRSIQLSYGRILVSLRLRIISQSKWILDADAGDHLSRIEILRQYPHGSAFGCGGNN